MFQSTTFIVLALSTLIVSARAADFMKDVRPIFEKHCFECHSEKAKKEKAGFVFDNVKRLANDVGEGRIIVPKKLDESDIVYIVTEATGKKAMPPSGKDRLSEEEVSKLKAWIEEGANLPGIDIAKKMADAKAARKVLHTPMNWTNKEGKALKATFVGLEGDFVLLKVESGQIYKYPLANLNPAGQIQAKMQAEE
jgi:mono/diheme cytochrome c family protein